jgi:hypothetical protein
MVVRILPIDAVENAERAIGRMERYLGIVIC